MSAKYVIAKCAGEIEMINLLTLYKDRITIPNGVDTDVFQPGT